MALALLHPGAELPPRHVGLLGAEKHPDDEACHRRTPDAPACTPSASATGAADQQATALDGVYRTSFTRKEPANSPLLLDPAEINDQNWGELTLTLDRGRVTFELRNELASAKSSGTFTVNGDAIVFTYTSGVEAGGTFAMRWSLYRDVLTFKRDPSLGGAPTSYLVKPWRRAG